MTDATPLASEQITQEDREAAHDLWAAMLARGPLVDEQSGKERAREMQEAFARHRIAALSATPAPSDQDASQAQGEGFVCPECKYAAPYHYTTCATKPDTTRLAFEQRVPAPGATAQDGVGRITKDWCLRMAEHEAETGGEIGAGMPDHPLRAPEHTPTPTIPAGMVAVPVKPTEAMIEAWADAEEPEDHPTEAHLNPRRYAAMLAAAPKQAEQQGVVIEALDYAIKAVGKEADHAMHVTRASRWVVEEIEAKEARFKRALAALNAPTGAVEKGEAK